MNSLGCRLLQHVSTHFVTFAQLRSPSQKLCVGSVTCQVPISAQTPPLSTNHVSHVHKFRLTEEVSDTDRFLCSRTISCAVACWNFATIFGHWDRQLSTAPSPEVAFSATEAKKDTGLDGRFMTCACGENRVNWLSRRLYGNAKSCLKLNDSASTHPKTPNQPVSMNREMSIVDTRISPIRVGFKE